MKVKISLTTMLKHHRVTNKVYRNYLSVDEPSPNGRKIARAEMGIVNIRRELVYLRGRVVYRFFMFVRRPTLPPVWELLNDETSPRGMTRAPWRHAAARAANSDTKVPRPAA